MSQLKEIAKRIPGLRSTYHKCAGLALGLKSTEEVFSEIYAANKFRGRESASGPGSGINETRVIISELPKVFAKFDCRTILDLPCGDFHWMKHVDLTGMEYIGADIVTALVESNQRKYAKANIRFHKLDLIKDELPRVDLILCRDCLVHLSFKDAFRALHNVCASDSDYFLSTTFTRRRHNRDIATGQWRAVNLEAAPFNLPPPLKMINEETTEGGEANRDKSLGLWKVADLRQALAARS
jgi:SAM-dependent methyltransferase